MRRSSWTPSIGPNGNDKTVCLVADDFGKPGRACRVASSNRLPTHRLLNLISKTIEVLVYAMEHFALRFIRSQVAD